MDTSVTLIGSLLTLIICIPLFFIFRSNIVNRVKIKEIKKKYSGNNQYNFSLTQIQNKKILSLDKINKGFLFIDFSYKEETTYFIDLKNIILCNILTTAENKSETITKIDVEFIYKDTMKKEIIPIYNIDNYFLDFNCLHEDHQLAKKWVSLLNECLL